MGQSPAGKPLFRGFSGALGKSKDNHMKLFWSYARLDDTKGKVSKLASAFEDSMSQAMGKRCRVFLDKSALRWGSKWREEIEKHVVGSNFLISIVSPSYFNRKMCIYEVLLATKNQIEILPIYYRKCKHKRSEFVESDSEPLNAELNKASLVLFETQMKDFRKLRNKDVNAEEVQDFLDRIADGLV